MTWWLLCSICSRFKAPPNTTCGMSTIRLSTSRAAGCWLSDRWLSEEFEMTDWEIVNHHKMTWWLLCSLCSRFKAPPNTTCGMSTSDCRLSDRAGVGSLSGLSDEFEMTDWCIKSNSDALLSVGLIEIFARHFTIWKASNESNASLSLSLHCIVKCLANISIKPTESNASLSLPHCFVLFVVVSRPHQTQHVAFNTPRVVFGCFKSLSL